MNQLVPYHPIGLLPTSPEPARHPQARLVSNTGLMRTPLYTGLGIVAAALVFSLLVDESDESQLRFDPRNATYPVDCTSPWEDEDGPVPFVDGAWQDTVHPDDHLDRPASIAYVNEVAITELVEGSPGPEVAVGIYCNSGGSHSTFEVQVFAGNSSSATRLGQVLHGRLEWAGSSWPVVQTSQRRWMPSDPHCCPSRTVLTSHEWLDDRWVETSTQVWVKEPDNPGS